MSKPQSLSFKLRRFVNEYVATGNATEAAKRAGYSPKTAYSQGQRLLKNVEVKNLLRARLDEEEVVAGEVLRELKRIAFADPRRFVDDAGNLRPVTQWTAEMGAAVASVEVIVKNAKAGDGHTDLIHKIRFNSKTRALEVRCRHLGRSPSPTTAARTCRRSSSRRAPVSKSNEALPRSVETPGEFHAMMGFPSDGAAARHLPLQRSR